VRAGGQSRNAERDALARPVPVARVRDEAHRDGRAAVDGRESGQAAALRERLDGEHPAHERRARERVREAHDRFAPPGPLRLVRAVLLRQLLARLRERGAQQLGVSLELFGQPLARARLYQPINERVRVRVPVATGAFHPGDARDDAPAEGVAHVRGQERRARGGLDFRVPLGK
jgi:hypothetical protein